ncbi:hypothetical protein INT47_002437 [Mucor saturninus]|uniref:Uncharacterized protein n=1 Tax=Mucor saturninus TaxID=64648 RepID=A0A8H7RHH1_9FUNG|nr:hypothetical protein INT47_002437 [Mucor saturninus]
MVPIVPMNYNNEHYKAYMNGNEYQQAPPPPPPPLQHQQPMPIPMALPMMNHLMAPHHLHPPNFFAHPPPPPPPPQPMYATDGNNGQYMDYVQPGYHTNNVGYMHGKEERYYPMISVYVPALQNSFAISSSILCRSPVLHQRIMDDPSTSLELDLYVLQETFDIIMGHLNRPISHQDIIFYASKKPHIAIELLEASEELGLEQLLEPILGALNHNLNHQKTAMIYVNAMEPYQPLEEEEPRRWVELLEEDVVSFMVKGLSAQLDAFSTHVKVSGDFLIGQIHACGYMPSRTPPKHGLIDLARAYAALPQHLMIRCLEHPNLPVQDAIQRSSFAKTVLAMVESMNQHQHHQHQQHQQQQQQQHPLPPQQQQQQIRQNQHSTSTGNHLMAVMKFENGRDTIAVVRQTGLKKGSWDPKLYELHQ